MILRQIARELTATANEFPVVTIIGPRQAGKTTLARMQFPNHAYANLEAPDIRLLATSDPHAFFSQFPPTRYYRRNPARTRTALNHPGPR